MNVPQLTRQGEGPEAAEKRAPCRGGRGVTALATEHTHLGSQIHPDTGADQFSLPIMPQLSGYKLWCGKT